MKTALSELRFSMWPLVRFVVTSMAVLTVAGLLVFLLTGAARPAGVVVPIIPASTGAIPRPDHVVIVIDENKDYSEIIGSSCCDYINTLADTGALMSDSRANEHPSQPNYLDLFSGSDQGVTTNSCPHTFSSANLGKELLAAGLTFGGYAEDLPSVGSTICTTGRYARRHAPWINFSNVPSALSMPLTSFPTDFNQLPTVSIVIPNLCNDMHDCSRSTGDAWLKSNLDGYIRWARTHNSLFIFTFDENSGTSGNKIATIFAGQMVKPGKYSETINHFSVLRTLEDMYNLSHAGQSANADPITDIWLTGSAATAVVTPTSGASTGVFSFQQGLLPNTGYTGAHDTSLKQDHPSDNYGNATTLEVDGGTRDADKAILIKWDISSIPPGKTVTAATLTFRVANTSSDTYQLYEMKRNWVDSEATWKIYATGNNWQSAGADGASDRGTAILGVAGPAASGALHTITLNAAGLALVQSWINNPGSNFGLMIANTDNTDGLDFSSSEASTTADRPMLTITYR
jgi:hypothetical protein